MYCVLCKTDHEDVNWRHKQWIEGQPDGWACSKWFTPRPLHSMVEFVPSEMKEARKQYADEQVQPYRQGELSREFVNLHPDKVKGMVKSGIVTKQQVKQSKHVWKNDLKGLSARATS